MFEDFDDYDGYRAREAMRVCPQCGRPELFCDDETGEVTVIPGGVAG